MASLFMAVDERITWFIIFIKVKAHKSPPDVYYIRN